MEKIIDSEKAKAFRSLIEGSEKIVLTCHVRPDGDAVGSTLGLWHLMRALGKEATVIVPDKPPVNLSFLPGFKEIGIFTCHPDFCRRSVSEADLLICCDFNKPSRQDSLEEVMKTATCKKVLIDHHQDPDDFTDLAFSFPDMSSTCELAFRIIAAMGLYGEVDRAAATCLFTGIITDTRNLTVNCKHPDLMEIVMRLLEKDVDKERIIREALFTRSLNSIRLEAFALSEKMEVYPAHRCSLITLDREELDRFHYERGDTEGLVNRPLEVPEIIYSVYMREDPDCIKVSTRSKDNFPVSKICEDLFNGGGHIQAAGGEFKGTLEECRAKFLSAMADYDKYFKPYNRADRGDSACDGVSK